MIIPHSVTLFLGWMAESARNGTIYTDLFILLVLVCLSPAIIGLLWSLIRWITKNDTDQGSDNRLHESQQYSSYSPDSRDRTQYSPPKATIDDSKQKLVRTRLRKFDLSEEEAKLVFGTEWKDVLGKIPTGNSSGLFYDMLIIQSQILLDMSYRNKIFHIIDQVIRMIDSVFSEDLELVRSYEKFLDGRFGHGWHEYYKNQWEFFKAYKKTSFEINSENTLDEDYKIMKLDITATLDQIKEKFRVLALIKHPDKNNTNKTQSEQEFVKILQAYERIVTSKNSGGK